MQDGIRQVQADLCERIDGLRAAVPFGTVAGLCDKASDLRHIAQRHALRPIADLAWKLEGRLARGERGPAVLHMPSSYSIDKPRRLVRSRVRPLFLTDCLSRRFSSSMRRG